jgi:2-oxoglutarate/2-oxoacid ferredoxin oxidoreductase subunit beta
MNTGILKNTQLPYCKGCGHDLIARMTAEALEKLQFKPLDVIAVTDIGCHGIIDKCLNTHTVHGLHGRSPALGAGISFGIDDPTKKIIVFIGDGGCTIGLQHIMEAARLNLNMTLLVHNNMLYGMTGGQTSGLTPSGFCTTTSFEGNPFVAYDLCALAHTAGAGYVSRIMGLGDCSNKLAEAFSYKGFSLVEVLEICPSYGVKYNPGRKLKEIAESAGRPEGTWQNERQPFHYQPGKKSIDLLRELKPVVPSMAAFLNTATSIVMSGSAGEGVQLAANFLAKAAMLCGLEVTQKGSYPVTVGVGFSTAEINMSPDPIHFHGIGIPDYAMITSIDGLAHSLKRINGMTKGLLFIDESLDIPETGATIIRHDFRSMGARNASLFSAFVFAKSTGLLPVESLFEIILQSGKANKLPFEKIKARL